MQVRSLSAPSLAALAARLEGGVITPSHPGYDERRQVVAGHVDKKPSAIVRAARTDDVRRVVAFAAEEGLELAVRGGGHSPAGHGTTDGGVLLDLNGLDSLDIDVEAGTAWAGTGHTAGSYTRRLGAHGLATGFGDMGSVGIGGITLAGGIGLLVRKHGLTIDSLLGAELVTADRRVVVTDAEHDPDLFWAVRGGGGNFGVVTRLGFRLHPVDMVVGGMIVMDATAQAVAGVMDAAFEAPNDLTAIVMVMKAPPVPFLPSEVHGRNVVLINVVHAGDPDDAGSALAPFRNAGAVLVDDVAVRPYPDLFPHSEDEFRPTVVGRSLFFDRFDRTQAAQVVDAVSSATSAVAGVQFRVLGGAVADVADGATAFAHRRRRAMAQVVAMYDGEDDLADQRRWVQDVAATVAPGEDSAYVGFLGDEGPDRVRAAYPGETWGRLRQVKRRYDPDNLFRLNQNIPPSTEADVV